MVDRVIKLNIYIKNSYINKSHLTRRACTHKKSEIMNSVKMTFLIIRGHCLRDFMILLFRSNSHRGTKLYDLILFLHLLILFPGLRCRWSFGWSTHYPHDHEHRITSIQVFFPRLTSADVYISRYIEVQWDEYKVWAYNWHKKILLCLIWYIVMKSIE